MRVAICSLAGDLHALRVWEALTERHGVACELVEIDRLVGRAFTWELERRADAIVPALGNELRLAEVDAVWWRRTSRGQIGTDCLDPIAREVIDVSWSSAMLGAFRRKDTRDEFLALVTRS